MSKTALVQSCFWETWGFGPPLSLPANKHPYLFSLGRIAAEATSPCRREITSYQWRLSPGQGSRVVVGGGIGVAEQRSSKETVCWGQSGQAAPNLMEYLVQPMTRLSFHQLHQLFCADPSVATSGLERFSGMWGWRWQNPVSSQQKGILLLVGRRPVYSFSDSLSCLFQSAHLLYHPSAREDLRVTPSVVLTLQLHTCRALSEKL